LGQNLTDAELTSLISRVDSNRNGTIEFEEFIHLVEGKKQVSFEDDVQKAFDLFDKVIFEQTFGKLQEISRAFNFRMKMDSSQ